MLLTGEVAQEGSAPGAPEEDLPQPPGRQGSLAWATYGDLALRRAALAGFDCCLLHVPESNFRQWQPRIGLGHFAFRSMGI